ncbi:hypothetical protein HWV62_10172 [Athelia sp. TMB]|nr:hypothetical protein HWV62_10172 [Athelia sp. TMB]
MSSASSVLLIGLPWDHPEVAEQFYDPAVIRDGTSIRGGGCTQDYFPIGLDDVLAGEALVDQLREKKYDGVIIGFGVRSAPDLTVFFEG